MSPARETPFDYAGPEDLRPRIVATLEQVVDPELAMSIVDVGLVYGVHVDASVVEVAMTMTSAACPVTDVIVEDVYSELEKVLPRALGVRVKLVWEPAWTPERMSARAKDFMGW